MAEDAIPLTRDRLVEAAVAVADQMGIAAVTMRGVAAEFGVTPMSLYNHVDNKEDLLDGIVDAVFAEMELPRIGEDWASEVRLRCRSMRAALVRHPWAIGLLETRANPGPATLGHNEAFIGTLRAAGLPVDLVARAVAVIDAFVYGFALEETTLPFEGPESIAELAGPLLQQMDRYPYLTELAAEHVLQPGYDFGDQFDFGLDLILGGIEQLAREAGA